MLDDEVGNMLRVGDGSLDNTLLGIVLGPMLLAVLGIDEFLAVGTKVEEALGFPVSIELETGNSAERSPFDTSPFVPVTVILKSISLPSKTQISLPRTNFLKLILSSGQKVFFSSEKLSTLILYLSESTILTSFSMTIHVPPTFFIFER